jgi:hypothetical protein
MAAGNALAIIKQARPSFKKRKCILMILSSFFFLAKTHGPATGYLCLNRILAESINQGKFGRGQKVDRFSGSKKGAFRNETLLAQNRTRGRKEEGYGFSLQPGKAAKPGSSSGS